MSRNYCSKLSPRAMSQVVSVLVKHRLTQGSDGADVRTYERHGDTVVEAGGAFSKAMIELAEADGELGAFLVTEAGWGSARSGDRCLVASAIMKELGYRAE